MPTPTLLLDPFGRRIEGIFTDHDLARLRSCVDVRWGRNEPISPEQLAPIVPEIDIIVGGSWDAERYGHPSRFPRLRAILEVGGALPSIHQLDYEYCLSHGIRVLSSAPAFGPAVAEMGLGLALACARQIAWTDREFRSGQPCWDHRAWDTEIGVPFTLYGRRVGLVGFGGIAQWLVRLLAPFGCEVQVYDPWLTDTQIRNEGGSPVGIEELLTTSRVVFVVAAPSSSNGAFLGRSELELIRSDSVLVLLSRAHVVDFDVLTELLLQGRFRAGIDVFPEEPIREDHPIRRAEHAVLSSHRAGAINDAIKNIGRMVTDDVQALSEGLAPHSMQSAQPEYVRLRGI